MKYLIFTIIMLLLIQYSSFAQDSLKTVEFNNGSFQKEQIVTKKENFYFKGQTDAQMYYKNSTGAVLGTLGVGLLSPLVALIPAIASTVKPPKDENLDYPDAELFENEEYKRGYKSKAKKIKQGRVWGAWGGSLLAAIIVQAVKNDKK
jgi:hypothetical protein